MQRAVRAAAAGRAYCTFLNAGNDAERVDVEETLAALRAAGGSKRKALASAPARAPAPSPPRRRERMPSLHITRSTGFPSVEALRERDPGAVLSSFGKSLMTRGRRDRAWTRKGVAVLLEYVRALKDRGPLRSEWVVAAVGILLKCGFHHHAKEMMAGHFEAGRAADVPCLVPFLTYFAKQGAAGEREFLKLLRYVEGLLAARPVAAAQHGDEVHRNALLHHAVMRDAAAAERRFNQIRRKRPRDLARVLLATGSFSRARRRLHELSTPAFRARASDAFWAVVVEAAIPNGEVEAEAAVRAMIPAQRGGVPRAVGPLTLKQFLRLHLEAGDLAAARRVCGEYTACGHAVTDPVAKLMLVTAVCRLDAGDGCRAGIVRDAEALFQALLFAGEGRSPGVWSAMAAAYGRVGAHRAAHGLLDSMHGHDIQPQPLLFDHIRAAYAAAGERPPASLDAAEAALPSASTLPPAPTALKLPLHCPHI